MELGQRLVDQTAPIIKPLFAPLPTITEVGKIGVLTGRDRPTPSADYECHAATKGWYANLCLVNSSSETFLHLKVVARAPFAGESQPISRLDPFTTQTPIILNLTASVEQQGKTRVPFELRYQPGDGGRSRALRLTWTWN